MIPTLEDRSAARGRAAVGRALLLVAAATAALLAARPAAGAVTVMTVDFANTTGGAVDDLHVEVSHTGGGVGFFRRPRLTAAAADQAPSAPTAGWARGAMAATRVDFAASAAGAPLADGARGRFVLQNNTNYLRVSSAHWTLGGQPVRDAQGRIVPATPEPRGTTGYAYVMLPEGQLWMTAFGSEPLRYDRMLAGSGVDLAALLALFDPQDATQPTLADFEALGGTLLARDLDGGELQGSQAWSGPAVAPGRGMYIAFADDRGGLFAVAGDAQLAPEPATWTLVAAAGLAGLRVRRRRRALARIGTALAAACTVSSAGAAFVRDQGFDALAAGSFTALDIEAAHWVGQAFIVGRSGRLDGVGMQVRRMVSDPPNGDLIVDIRPLEAGVPSDDPSRTLASVAIAPDAVPLFQSPGAGFVEVDLRDHDLHVTSGLALAIVLRTAGQGAYTWHYHPNPAGGERSAMVSRHVGLPWDRSAIHDTGFVTYVPEPGGAPLVAAALAALALGRAAGRAATAPGRTRPR